MKIAFVLTQSLDSPSGLGRYGPLARELVKLGHQVELLALHYDWASLPQKSFIDKGVQVHYVGQMHVQKSGAHKTYFGPGKLPMVSLNATLKLARAVARSQAEVIHLGKPQPFNVLAAQYGRRGRPLFCDCDDYEAETNKFSSGWQKSVVRYFEDSIVKLADGLTVNTHFLQERYCSLGFSAKKIQIVPNGVERSSSSVFRGGSGTSNRRHPCHLQLNRRFARLDRHDRRTHIPKPQPSHNSSGSIGYFPPVAQPHVPRTFARVLRSGHHFTTAVGINLPSTYSVAAYHLGHHP